ncbi:methyltransferase domain-containing protein [Candidatus Woesearchaeota archaeon]|nr:methyltransferase domain-containing protein [Candidatus Woesearchaeota archaeon]
MKGIVITDKGLEETALKEIVEKIKSKGKIEETVVKFEIKKEEELCKLAYTCQSLRRVLLLFKEFKVEKKLEKNIALIKKINLKKYSSEKVSVECERYGEHSFNSVDFARETSKILDDKGFKVLRKENDLIFYVYIYNNKGYFCLDFSGRDLSKRNYRIFTKPGSLKGTLGFGLVKMSGYKVGEIIVDPYCESGVIPIETALFASKKPVNFYKKEFAFKKINKNYEKIFEKEDKKTKKKVKDIYALDKTLKNITDSKKNAKIAGVDKNINFSKAEIEWLDTKFEKESVDKIVTKLPSESKKLSQKVIGKIYQEMFYQAEFVLKKKGVMVICTMKNGLLKQLSDKKNFEIVDEKKMFSGQQEYFITIFKKVYK